MRDLGINSRLGYCFQCRLDKYASWWNGGLRQREETRCFVGSCMVRQVSAGEEKQKQGRCEATRCADREGKEVYV